MFDILMKWSDPKITDYGGVFIKQTALNDQPQAQTCLYRSSYLNSYVLSYGQDSSVFSAGVI